jgi:chemotaxis protein CheX
MKISSEELEQLTREVWATMIGLDLADAVMAENPDPGVTSQIEIHGDEQATLRIDCSMDLARQVAARLFDMSPEEIEMELILDAMGEMANVIGGQVKGQWSGAVKLSLPVTKEVGDADSAMTWSVSQGFSAEDGQMLVRMNSSAA